MSGHRRRYTAAPPSALHILDKSTFRQRHARTIAHDDVIEQADVDQGQCFLDSLRDELVRLRRLRDAPPVVVRNDHPRRVAQPPPAGGLLTQPSKPTPT